MLIADTSPLVAILNAKDKHHQARTALFRRFRSPVIAPTPIITEVAYFLQIESGPVVEAAFLDASARGELVVEATTVQELARMADLVRQYTDSPRRSARSIARLSSCCRPTAGTCQGRRGTAALLAAQKGPALPVLPATPGHRPTARRPRKNMAANTRRCLSLQHKTCPIRPRDATWSRPI